MDFFALDKGLNKGEVPRVLYLLGDEPYLIEMGIEGLRKKIIPDHLQEFNRDIYSAGEIPASRIVDAARTLPMLNPWRFILVKGADHFPPGEVDQFLPYIERPSPSTCLVLWGNTGGPWKQFFPKIRGVGAVIHLKSLFAGQLIGWIKREVQAYGKGMTREAAEYLKDMVGNRLRDLHNEIEKVVAYVGENPIIELGDVEELVSEVKTRTIFELTDAIGTRNSLEALRILRRMLQAGEAHLKILNMIARQFRLIWKARYLVSKGIGKEELGRRLKVHHFYLESILEQTAYFSEDNLGEGFHRFLQTDRAMKTTTLSKELLLEKMVVDLCH